MFGDNTSLEWMTHQRGLTAIVLAYVYAALLVAGPWIFTIFAIFGLSYVDCASGCEGLSLFRSIVIYNSLHSLIVTSPLAFLAGRHISDAFFAEKTECIFFAFVASFVVFCLVSVATIVPWYLLATTLSGPMRLAAVQNVLLIGTAWLLIPFLGVIRAPIATLAGFGGNALLMTACGLCLANPTAMTLLNVLNAGFAATNIVLIGALVRKCGTQVEWDAGLVRFPPRLWELPLAGLAYAVGIWIDKVIMWFGAPSGGLMVAGLRTMPSYDTAMFWAQLAVIPVLAVAFVHVETQFRILFSRFYGRFDQQASLRELNSAMHELRRCVMASVSLLFVSLAITAAMAILSSFVFMDQLGLRPAYMSILRIALCAMAFHASSMFCFVFFLYFDLRRPALLIVVVYAVLNAGFTLLFLHLGQSYYGYGNLTAAVITFSISFTLLLRELPWLLYHAFITNNTSLQTKRRPSRIPLPTG